MSSAHDLRVSNQEVSLQRAGKSRRFYRRIYRRSGHELDLEARWS